MNLRVLVVLCCLLALWLAGCVIVNVPEDDGRGILTVEVD